MPVIVVGCEREYTSQERAALIGFWLGQGECLTDGQVAHLTGLTAERARHLMVELSRVLPIHRAGKRWQLQVFGELAA